MEDVGKEAIEVYSCQENYSYYERFLSVSSHYFRSLKNMTHVMGRAI